MKDLIVKRNLRRNLRFCLIVQYWLKIWVKKLAKELAKKPILLKNFIVDEYALKLIVCKKRDNKLFGF